MVSRGDLRKVTGMIATRGILCPDSRTRSSKKSRHIFSNVQHEVDTIFGKPITLTYNPEQRYTTRSQSWRRRWAHIRHMIDVVIRNMLYRALQHIAKFDL